MKLIPSNGTIVWSRIYTTNITAVSNVHLPIVNINNFTKFIYLAAS